MSGQKLTIDSLDEHRDHCMREDRKRESIVHDWVFRHTPLIHDFPPHTDHSTSQDPKAPFPVDRHSATEFAPGRPDAGPERRETPTDDRLATFSSGKYQSETKESRDRQRFTPPIRRLHPRSKSRKRLSRGQSSRSSLTNWSIAVHARSKSRKRLPKSQSGRLRELRT